MRSRSGGERGQAFVELVAVVGLLLLIVMGAVQFGVLYSIKLKVTHGAREGARWAALHALANDDAVIKAHVIQAAIDLTPPVTPEQITLMAAEPRTVGQPITVRIDYAGAPRMPITGAFLPDPLVISAQSCTRIEE